MFRIADAEENLGESEVREAHLAKALYFIRISDKVCQRVKVSHSAIQRYSLAAKIFCFVNLGESLGAAETHRRKNCCCGAKDGPGVLHPPTCIFLHGLRLGVKKH